MHGLLSARLPSLRMALIVARSSLRLVLMTVAFGGFDFLRIHLKLMVS